MLGVGNEQWGPAIHRALHEIRHRRIKAKHPEIKLVSAPVPIPADERFKFAWPKLRELNADIVDEHCYAKPDWFFDNTHRYDNYDRNGPKVFMGEYAAQSDKMVSAKNRNNLECALAEAAYMTGLERNADVVRMASYAPLFAHTEGLAMDARPDLGEQPARLRHAELLRPANVRHNRATLRFPSGSERQRSRKTSRPAASASAPGTPRPSSRTSR